MVFKLVKIFKKTFCKLKISSTGTLDQSKWPIIFLIFVFHILFNNFNPLFLTFVFFIMLTCATFFTGYSIHFYLFQQKFSWVRNSTVCSRRKVIKFQLDRWEHLYNFFFNPRITPIHGINQGETVDPARADKNLARFF